MSEKPQLKDQEIDLSPSADRLVVLYQPIVPLAESQTLTGVEALVRYQHPDYGLLTPDKFMPAIVTEARMAELTLALLGKICVDWREWRAIGHELSVAINIDTQLLRYRPLGRDMSAVLEQRGMPRRNLVLEISNPSFDDFHGASLDAVNRLRMAGFRLCLDNLRPNSAKLLSITQLPIDQVKIDRSIIKNVHEDPESQATVRKIVEAATQFGADVSAVGIESEAALDWLHRNGCHSGQGYFFGPPLAPDAFRQIYLENQQRWHVRSQPGRMNLLVVEDDPQYQVLLYETLSENYHVSVAHSLADARNAFATHSPALVVLDVELPDGSGIELCQELSNTYGSDSFSSLFVSGRDADDIKLAAYSAGGVDFLNKPFSMVELVVKLSRAASAQEKRQQQKTESESLKSAALGSMREAAHYGDVVQFMKKLFRAYDEPAMANELFRFMRSKNLVCSVQFRSPESFVSLTQQGTVCSPMEVNIFELLSKRGRIQDFNQRTIFNDQHVSVLIKNMPADVDERGRIRDYMAALIEGMEARFSDIMRRRALESVSDEVNKLATELAQNLHEDKLRNREMMENASMDLQMSFHVLSLTEEQEAHITQIIDRMHANAEESEISAQYTNDRVQNLVQLLSRVVDSQQPPDQSPEDDEGNDTVELF